MAWCAKWEPSKETFYFVNLADSNNKVWKLPEMDTSTVDAAISAAPIAAGSNVPLPSLVVQSLTEEDFMTGSRSLDGSEAAIAPSARSRPDELRTKDVLQRQRAVVLKQQRDAIESAENEERLSNVIAAEMKVWTNIVASYGSAENLASNKTKVSKVGAAICELQVAEAETRSDLLAGDEYRSRLRIGHTRAVEFCSTQREVFQKEELAARFHHVELSESREYEHLRSTFYLSMHDDLIVASVKNLQCQLLSQINDELHIERRRESVGR